MLLEYKFDVKQKWCWFVNALEVPAEEKEKMRAIVKTDQEKALRIALDWWINSTSGASWERLISSVYTCEEHNTASAMSRQLGLEGNYN